MLNIPLIIISFFGLLFSMLGSIFLGIEIFGIERLKKWIKSTKIFLRVTSIIFRGGHLFESRRLKFTRIIIITYLFLVVAYLIVGVFNINSNPELVTFLIVMFLLLIVVPIFFIAADKFLEATQKRPKFIFGIIGIIFLIFGFLFQFAVNVLTFR